MNTSKKTPSGKGWIKEYGQSFDEAYKIARSLMPYGTLEAVKRGWQTVAFIFKGSQNVIRISRLHNEYNVWSPEYGKRSFDCPISKLGIVQAKPGDLLWQIAPKAQVLTGNNADVERLIDTINHSGYTISDFRPDQCGYVKGVLRLIDYESAVKVLRV